MRLLLVGLGRIAWKGFNLPGVETHLQAILPNGAFELVGGVDPDNVARGEFMQRTGCSSSPDLATGLHAYQPEVVIICSPQQFHHEQTVMAANFKSVRGILVEKPMATTVDDATCMIEECEAHNVVLAVAHQRRYEARHKAAREYLSSGALGDILAAQATFSGDYLNNGTHAADVCRFLVGDDTPWSIKRTPAAGEFSVTVSGESGLLTLSSYGRLAPGYMTNMYLDFADALQRRGCVPACTGEDGLEAVRHALFAQERDANAA